MMQALQRLVLLSATQLGELRAEASESAVDGSAPQLLALIDEIAQVEPWHTTLDAQHHSTTAPQHHSDTATQRYAARDTAICRQGYRASGDTGHEAIKKLASRRIELSSRSLASLEAIWECQSSVEGDQRQHSY